MRIIYSWGHTHQELMPILEAEVVQWIDAGYQITSVKDREELGIVQPWAFSDLDKNYRNKHERLMQLYKKIELLAETHDILITNHGNVYHPEFIKSLKNKNIYTAIASADDPESSDYCSKPYVHAFDHSLPWGVNFDADTRMTEKFIEWGAKRADFWPYGVRHDMYDPALTVNDIYNGEREIDLMFVGGPYLKISRIAQLKDAFPEMALYGGWDRKTILKSPISCWKNRGIWDWKEFEWACRAFWQGMAKTERLPAGQLIPFYQKAKIGINIHMSFGPSNRRTYELPANGVMQMCDCAEGIGEIFRVGEEVVAYRSIEEAIELIKYYLDHDKERKEIAAAGFRRVFKDYGRVTTFSKVIESIKKGMLEDGITHFKDGTPIVINS